MAELFEHFDSGYREGSIKTSQDLYKLISDLFNSTELILVPHKSILIARLKFIIIHYLERRNCIPTTYEQMRTGDHFNL